MPEDAWADLAQALFALIEYMYELMLRHLPSFYQLTPADSESYFQVHRNCKHPENVLGNIKI
jgi:hypothetical protein